MPGLREAFTFLIGVNVCLHPLPRVDDKGGGEVRLFIPDALNSFQGIFTALVSVKKGQVSKSASCCRG